MSMLPSAWLDSTPVLDLLNEDCELSETDAQDPRPRKYFVPPPRSASRHRRAKA